MNSTHHGPADTRPLSRILADLGGGAADERISLGELTSAFGDRSFGLLTAILALASLLPAAALVFGVGILAIGMQMGIGRRVPKFPDVVARHTIRRGDIGRISEISARWIEPIERLVRPREGFFSTRAGEMICGWLAAFAAIVIILPGPMTNAPPAFGCLVMGVGIAQRDARVTGIGALITLGGAIFASVVILMLVWAAVTAASFVI